ncbi:hypothetical protein H5410_026407, partial [Solanum commersonii]
HMARCKHEGGQADGKKQHVLGVTRNLVDASTVSNAQAVQRRKSTFGVSDMKSPSNIASRKRCSNKCSNKMKGEPLKHLLSRRKAKTTENFYFSLFHQ